MKIAADDFYRTSIHLFTVIVIMFVLVGLASAQSMHGKPTVNGMLKINEIMAGNSNTLQDEDEDYDDWVELHNTAAYDIDIAGLYISDNPDRPDKFQIPSGNESLTRIKAGGFLLLWLDKETGEGENHIDFKLDQDGEWIGIYDRDGQTLIDGIAFGKQYVDVSYGRSNGNAWVFFRKPTPAAANSSTGLLETAEGVSISHPSGFYREKFHVTLTAKGKGKIYYTLDGKEPDTIYGISYKGSILIDSTCALRTAIFRKGYFSSPVSEASYFLDGSYTLPVVSLTTDPGNLFDPEYGIYHEDNYWENWRYPAMLEYFDLNGVSRFRQKVDIKLAGRYSRRAEKKSFTVQANKKYGSGRIHYPLFRDKAFIKSVDGFQLRADAMFGLNAEPLDKEGTQRKWAGERIKNELIYRINKEMGSNVDMQAYEPVILFINGKYWGLYNLMERKGVDFIHNNHNVKDIDLLNPYDKHSIVSGNMKHWESMIKYIEYNDMNEKTHYDRVGFMMDYQNFIDCWIYEVYIAKGDVNDNTRLWRPRHVDGQWRSISFDQDHWKDYHNNTINKYKRYAGGKSYLFKLLIKSKWFKYQFVNRFCDYLNTVLLPDTVQQYIREIDAAVAAEKPFDRCAWEEYMIFVEPGAQVRWLNHFAEKRPDYIYRFLKSEAKLRNTFKLILEVEPKGSGAIQVNTITLSQFPWNGRYYQDIPILVTAIAKEGYRFDSWTSNTGSETSPQVELTWKGQDLRMKAIFKPRESN